MNCFMSYNPNVAKEVKVTTWIKEFDGASPIYPSFPKDGDVFIVFDSDEDKTPSVNKTFSSGDWADTESDAPTGTIEITENGEGIDVSSYAYADVNVSGGGEVNLPIFTNEGPGEYSCNMTFEQIGINTRSLEDSDGYIPIYRAYADVPNYRALDIGQYTEDFRGFDVPASVTEGLVFDGNDILYGSDNNFYYTLP